MQRHTRQRSAIEAVFKSAERPLSIQELQTLAAEKVENIGQATVYRTVKHLLGESFIRKVDIPEKTPHYELADLHHHHHFFCETCEKVFEVEACPPGVNALAPKGFTVRRHEITLYGQCDACS